MLLAFQVLMTTALCGLAPSAEGSVDHHDHGAFALGPAPQPVVTSASSQYFERTFNRLVPTPFVPAPAVPVLPPPVIQANALFPAPAQFPVNTVLQPQPSVIQSHQVYQPQAPPLIPVQPVPPQRPLIQTHTVLQPQPSVIQSHQVYQPQAPPLVPVQPVPPQRPLIQTHTVLQPQPSVIQSHYQPQAPPLIPPQRPLIQTHSVLQPQPHFFFQPAPKVPVQVNPSMNASPPISNQSTDPNINIAIATAHAAAPVATILLPPYPFGLPPFGFPPFGFAPQSPETNPEEPREEATTQATTRTSQTTIIEPEQTTPLPAPSNTDNSFAQFPLPSPNNNNFKYGPPDVPFNYGPPPDTPRPIKPFPLQPTQIQQNKPLKLTTSVEIVPVPLAYMAPPPLTHAHYHDHHPHHLHRPHHHHAKIVKYYVRAVPAPVRAKIIIRPVSAVSISPHKGKYVKSHKYRVPVSWERNDVISGNEQLEPAKEREPTTMGPLNISHTKPPKL